jgi:voltage-gated potassium channel Kch
MKGGGRVTSPWRRSLERLRGVWGTEVGLSVFTALLALDVFVVSPLANLGLLGTGLIDSIFSLLLICGVLALHQGRILRVFLVSIVALALAFRWLGSWLPVSGLQAVGFFLAVVALGCFAAIVLKRVFEPGEVTRHRIHGAVCAYLLFGLMWAAAYAFIEHALPQAFSVARGTEPAEQLVARFVYFSFVTLTTVGYGDITAVHPLARTLVIAEALTGQLFPAIIIGGLVSSALQARSES